MHNWSLSQSVFSFVVVLEAGQPADELLERSLSADATSVTLESLQPDTEYVISLYPLFPRNSASPSILNARTCEFSLWFIINIFCSGSYQNLVESPNVK